MRVFDYIRLFHLFIFMTIPKCFYYYDSIAEFEVRDGDGSRSYFTVQDCLSCFLIFVFSYEDDYCSLKFSEELFGTIESVDCFW